MYNKEVSTYFLFIFYSCALTVYITFNYVSHIYPYYFSYVSGSNNILCFNQGLKPEYKVAVIFGYISANLTEMEIQKYR